MPYYIFRQPIGCESIAESLEHFDFLLFIELDRAAAGLCAGSECFERLVPLLQILEFLAEPVIEKRERALVSVILLYQLFQLLNVVSVFRFANILQDPVCIRIAMLHSENFVYHCFRFIQLAEKHVVVRLIDQERYVLWLLINRLRDPL